MLTEASGAGGSLLFAFFLRREGQVQTLARSSCLWEVHRADVGSKRLCRETGVSSSELG
jgi:hypothetical protein